MCSLCTVNVIAFFILFYSIFLLIFHFFQLCHLPALLPLPVVVLRALLQTRQHSSQQALQAWFQGLAQRQVVRLIQPQQYRLHRHSSVGE